MHIDSFGYYIISQNEIFKAFHDRWENYDITKPQLQKSKNNQTAGNKASGGCNTCMNSTLDLKLGNKAYLIKYQIIGGKVIRISASSDSPPHPNSIVYFLKALASSIGFIVILCIFSMSCISKASFSDNSNFGWNILPPQKSAGFKSSISCHYPKTIFDRSYDYWMQ